MILILTIALIPFAGSVNAAEKVETLTFAWDHVSAEGGVAVVNWQMEWGVTAGGPYTKLVDIPYAATTGASYESPVQAVVTGQPGTHETRYFILRACGDVPIEGGGTEYQCSDPSNEVSYNFWIPAGGYSAPVQFRILPQ